MIDMDLQFLTLDESSDLRVGIIEDIFEIEDKSFVQRM